MTSDRKSQNRDSELFSIKTKILYGNSFQASTALIFVTLVIVILSYNIFSDNGKDLFLLQTWAASAIIICLIRLLFAFQYRRSDLQSNSTLWRNIFYTTSALTGAVFGSSVFFVAKIHSPSHIALIVLILGAISAGSIGTLATSRAAFTLLNLFLLLPYSIYMIYQKAVIFQTTGGLVIVFLATIFLTAFRINNMLSKSLMLKVENDRIIKKLSQSEEKFSKSFYSGIAPMAMMRIDDAAIIDVNDSMLKLVGYSREEMIGKSPYDLEITSRPEEVINIIQEIADSKGRLQNREITLKTKNGIMKHCLLTVENYRLNESIIALVMLHDFTERLDYEKKLKIERDRAEDAASVKSKFLAVMSHEIRTPMNGIIGMTNLALISDDMEEVNEYLHVVKESAGYLHTLINDILDLSRLESGKVIIEPVDMDLHQTIRNIHKSLELIALSKKITLSYEINSDVPAYVKASPERLRQILYNLIGNAIKFTSTGGVTVRVSLNDGKDYDFTESGNYLEIKVTDTGIGISEDRIDKIFESFTQADSGTFRSYGGTGLGLTISKQLILMMNGKIRVESTVGSGSTFGFIIPLSIGEKPVSDIDFIHIKNTGGKKRILVAEDNLMNQRLIAAYLEKLGHSYEIAEDGQKALEILRTQHFDLILMDLEMPVLNGMESASMIQRGEAGEKNRYIPIYAMSAHIMENIKDECLTQGFAGYLTKPVALKSLKKILDA